MEVIKSVTHEVHFMCLHGAMCFLLNLKCLESLFWYFNNLMPGE